MLTLISGLLAFVRVFKPGAECTGPSAGVQPWGESAERTTLSLGSSLSVMWYKSNLPYLQPIWASLRHHGNGPAERIATFTHREKRRRKFWTYRKINLNKCVWQDEFWNQRVEYRVCQYTVQYHTAVQVCTLCKECNKCLCELFVFIFLTDAQMNWWEIDDSYTFPTENIFYSASSHTEEAQFKCEH